MIASLECQKNSIQLLKRDMLLVILHTVTNGCSVIFGDVHVYRSQAAVEVSFPDNVLSTDDPKLFSSCLCKYSKFSIILTVVCQYNLNTAWISDLVWISEQAIKSYFFT